MKRKPHYLFWPHCGPTALLTSLLLLPALSVASDPLLQVSTTAASLLVTHLVPDPISFSFSLLWL